MRLPSPLPKYIAAALAGGENQGLRVDADGRAWEVAVDGGRTPIGRAAEGRHFFFLLACNLHTRMCTLNAIRAERDLQCRFCLEDSDLAAWGIDTPSRYERLFFAAMQSSSLGVGLQPQVRLPFWHGMLDFVDRHTGVCIQVDGEQHFLRGMHCTPRSEYVTRDARNASAAMAAGRALVRVHYMDVHNESGVVLTSRILQAAAAAPMAPCVVLSPSFNLPTATTSTQAPTQIQLVRALAAFGHYTVRTDQMRYIWIHPANTHATHTP